MRTAALAFAAALAFSASPALACMTATTVLFERHSALLSPAAEATLRAFAEQVRDGGEWSAITLTGYSDEWEGRSAHGPWSHDRITAVSMLLMAYGVPARLIVARTGQRDPGPKSQADHARDRRVELYAQPAPSPAPPPGTPVPAC